MAEATLTKEEERARALELLKATHTFPGDYHLSVITTTGDEVFAAVRAAVEAGGSAVPEDGYQQIPSSGGKYTSHRFRIACASATDVLDLYERVRLVEGVVSLL